MRPKTRSAQHCWDGVGMGLGFTVALFIIATLREVLGAGEFLGIPLFGWLEPFGLTFKPVLIMIQPPGAFITLGLILALINHISKKRKQKQAKGAR